MTNVKTKPRKKPAILAKRHPLRKKVQWLLKLYVAGNTLRSQTAFANLKRICEEHLKDNYQIEIIDLIKKPQLAKGDQIFALPTLVRKLPTPIKKIIGDLSNSEKVLVGLNIKPLKVL